MTQLAISDELAAAIASAAETRNLSPEALLTSLFSQLEEDEAFAERVLQPLESEPTQAQIVRMRESIAQLDRGEVVTSEQVDLFFKDWLEELEDRAAKES